MALDEPLFPSTIDTSDVEIAGSGSSLVIVPTPCPSMTTALTTLVTFAKNVSLASFSVSPLTVTVKLALLAPAGIVWPARLRAT